MSNFGGVKVQDGSGNLITSTSSALDVNVKNSVAVSGTFWQATQPISGTVSISGTVPVSGTFWQATQPVSFSGQSVSITGTVDVSDRAVRLLGVVYGSQGQQLKQTATNFNTASELYTGATAYDARQIRALTSSDQVTVANSSLAVTGTFWQTTQPISGSVSVSNFPSSQAVTGTFWQTTQPVSGTVTSTQGAASAGAKWSVQVDNSSAIAVTDSAAETSLSTIAGAVTSSQMQVHVTNTSLPVTATTNADAPIAGGTSPSSALVAGGTYNNPRISLTAGQSAGLSLDNDGSLLVSVDAGSNTIGNVNIQSGGTPLTNTGGALNVNIAGGSSSGVQYVEGASPATPTGTVVLGQTTGTGVLQALQTDTNGNLIVSSLDGTILDTQAAITTVGPGITYSTPGYGFLSFQFGGIWSGAIRVEASNDGANWIQQYVQYLGSGYITDVINLPTIVQVTAASAYMRYYVTGLNSGTITVKVVGNTGVIPTTSLLGMSFDAASGVQQNVNVANVRLDTGNAMVLSDAPAPIIISGNVGQTTLIVDTQGYQSLNITTAALAATVTCSNDKITWSNLSGAPLNWGALTTTIAANTGYTFPCIARYIRFVPTTAGGAVVYLRNQSWVNYTSSAGTPMAVVTSAIQVGGVGVVAAGQNGVVSIGGNVAVGGAANTNPVTVGGVDSGGLVRRVIVDTSGRLAVTNTAVDLGTDQTNTVRSLGLLSPSTSMQNVAPMAVQDLTQFEGQSIAELLAQILIELRISNYYQFSLPTLLTTGTSNSTGDEPAALRNDPSISTVFG
jgi:hypothetical protein